MTSDGPGTATFPADVLDLTPRGFRVRLGDEELQVPYAEFPWFRGAPEAAIRNVRRPSAGHLHWPDLDVDLEVDSIRHPEQFPLVARVGGDRG